MKFEIAVLAGDGIGPEVVKQGVKVLDAIQDATELQFEYTHCAFGACSIEEFGEPLTKETLDACEASDGILFGAIGDPKYDNDPTLKVRPEQGLLRLRKELGLFANIRPVQAYDFLLDQSPLKADRIKDVDLTIYRELTSGIYFGDKSEGVDSAFDVCSYERNEVERIVSLAFEAAMQRSKKLCLVDKANVMASSRLWRDVCQRIAHDHPEVELSMMFVDNAAMQLILNPKQFDVIVTSNMFGDILSDEASVIAGALGLLASASVGEKTALFEPIHGSFPEAKGKNIANPVGTILSVGMLLDHLGRKDLGDLVRAAVDHSFDKGVVTQDLNPDYFFTTEEVGAYIALDVAKRLELVEATH